MARREKGNKICLRGNAADIGNSPVNREANENALDRQYEKVSGGSNWVEMDPVHHVPCQQIG